MSSQPSYHHLKVHRHRAKAKVTCPHSHRVIPLRFIHTELKRKRHVLAAIVPSPKGSYTQSQRESDMSSQPLCHRFKVHTHRVKAKATCPHSHHVITLSFIHRENQRESDVSSQPSSPCIKVHTHRVKAKATCPHSHRAITLRFIHTEWKQKRHVPTAIVPSP